MIKRLLNKTLMGVCAIGICQVTFGANLCVNPRGNSGCKSSISAAVTAASPGDTIHVARGFYKDDVVITKSLSLIGDDRQTTIIDATGKANGIFIDGTASAPNAGVSDVTISGFTVQNANFEGILAASATGVVIADNLVTNNNASLSASTCPGIPDYETNEDMDCGEGIHLLGTNHSIVSKNIVERNSGGILISDETGPTNNNLITGNFVQLNGFACGITMASHAPAALAHPTAGLSFGVFNNTISRNESDYNGLQNGGGAGVGVYSPGPGAAAYGNVIIQNTVLGNGLPGIAMHNHASVPGAPPIIFRDNSVIGNHIRGNGADTEDAQTAGPTGINIYSVVPVTGIVVAENVIEDEAIGISFKSAATGPDAVPQLQAHFNIFERRTVGISNLGAATTNGTLNWWGCSDGPQGRRGCASTTTGVSFSPWLTDLPSQRR
jgi:parallel beta-helix repeat protein